MREHPLLLHLHHGRHDRLVGREEVLRREVLEGDLAELRERRGPPDAAGARRRRRARARVTATAAVGAAEPAVMAPADAGIGNSGVVDAAGTTSAGVSVCGIAGAAGRSGSSENGRCDVAHGIF